MTIWYEFRGIVIAAAMSIAVVAGALVWLLAIRDGGEGATARVDGARLLGSETDLAVLSADVGHPVYWPGERAGTRLEATMLEDGQVFVRYLDEGAAAGDPRPQFLSVGTYPVRDAYETLEAVARLEGSAAESLDDGALVVQSAEAPESVYMAYPGHDLQIEVYDPDARRALRIATSGAIHPVE